ncbi:MAG: hypothetical protein JST39_13415, partial [Bacteroidetes bacterium]|nr:hypothetical protein [Bacteroidota bacterium]
MTCPRRRISFTLYAFVLTLLIATGAAAQMRQVYLDNNTNNHIRKICFYSGSEGYVSFTNWLGYTSDSGKTFTPKYVTTTNVDINGYFPNWTFGFDIGGVKAFNKDTLILYGNFGQVPSILYSVNGGSTYKLVYQSQLILSTYSYGVTDMVFPANSNIGFATEADRMIRTTDRGKTWVSVREDAGSFFDYIEATDDNNLFVFATTPGKTKLLKTTNGGAAWQQMTLPSGDLRYAYFLTPAKGWLNMFSNGFNDFYYTSDAGTHWTKMNTPEVTGYYGFKMKFVNDSTGYIIGYQFNTFKTTDSGRRWEPLPRNNNYENGGFSHLDIHFRDSNEFWAGGDFGFLELTGNGGGTPLPKAFYRIDTT